MYTFRFNPVFNQWVLLGGAVAAPLELTPAHYLDVGKQGHFVAATYPRQPFIMEPPAKHASEKDLLYASQPPVGEYELLLFEGEETPFRWPARNWDQWLMLLQQRLTQLHSNPYLHFIHFTLNTQALGSVSKYQRVGDLVAVSHPIAGSLGALTLELADKISEKEELFVVEKQTHGRFYVPSAPLQEKEIWYLPSEPAAGMERMAKAQREELAQGLALIFRSLHTEFPETHFVLSLHTSFAGKADDTVWWLQIHEARAGQNAALPVRSLPETFVQRLHYALAHQRRSSM